MQNSYLYKSKLFIAFFFIITSSILKAEHNTTVDRAYKSVSKGIIDLSEYLDTSISDWASFYNKKNVECVPEPIKR